MLPLVGDPVAEAAPTLSAGTTRADFYSGPYRISADVFTGDRRLLDALRDVTRHYLEIRHLRVSPQGSAERSVAYPDGLLNKAEIDWVAIRAEPSRAEARLYRFVQKTPIRVALIMGAHSIDGTVFVDSGATDPAVFFLRGLAKASDQFLAVASARITSAGGETEDVEVTIVNRTAVRMFSASR